MNVTHNKVQITSKNIFYPDNITSHEGHVVNIRPAQAETNIMAKKMPHVQSAFTELTGQRKENMHIWAGMQAWLHNPEHVGEVDVCV